MKFIQALVALATATAVNAHFTLQYQWVNGVDAGYLANVRPAPSNNPVTDVTSTDLTCNVGGTSGSGTTTATVPSGANITLEWHQHAARTGEDAISGGHKGPVLVYIAKAPSSVSSFNGQGKVWTKIYQSGLLNPSSQTWATDIVNSNNGRHSVVLPKSLPAGEYLIRAEIIALHVAGSVGGAQFYVGCSQIKISSGGNASPPTIAIPGAYSATDPGILVNIYNSLQSYTFPGGAVWSG